MELKTERLILRDIKAGDFSAMLVYRTNANNFPFMVSAPKDEKGVREYIERSISENEKNPRLVYNFAAILKSTGTLVGDCGIYPYLKDGWSEAAVEWILHKDYWGNGYGSEIALALLNFGFQLKIHRIYATCDTGNLASSRIMEKHGMRKEAHCLESRPGRAGVKDRYYDEFLYAILEDEWIVRSK